LRLEGAVQLNCRIGNVDRQHVAGRDSGRGTANGLPVDADGSLVDPRLHPGARSGLEVRQMPAKHEIQPRAVVAAIAQECADPQSTYGIRFRSGGSAPADPPRLRSRGPNAPLRSGGRARGAP
jgi:hypothetical protein